MTQNRVVGKTRNMENYGLDSVVQKNAESKVLFNFHF